MRIIGLSVLYAMFLQPHNLLGAGFTLLRNGVCVASFRLSAPLILSFQWLSLSELLDYSEKLLKHLKLINSIVENIFHLSFQKM